MDVFTHHFNEGGERKWLSAWIHHRFEPNCLRQWFEQTGRLPE
jgi:hypothetical protein